MPYAELIKNFSVIRYTLRDFCACGFRVRGEYTRKSARSYDDERRRAESWLGESMSFRRDGAGKRVFVSVDGRSVTRNPLYGAWKASRFTRNDLSLHFLLLDILSGGESLTAARIVETIASEYLPYFDSPDAPDESTVRKKLKEYEEAGILERDGRAYRLRACAVPMDKWRDAAAFFAEENALGVVGSYILDGMNGAPPSYFSFKHHYILYALDCEIVLRLLCAIRERRRADIVVRARDGGTRALCVAPLRIFESARGGRRYVAAYNPRRRRVMMYRVDAIERVEAGGPEPHFDVYCRFLSEMRKHMWGVSRGDTGLKHVEMRVTVEEGEEYVAERLAREKRCGTVRREDERTWLFAADVYDPMELMPWIRSFTGRVASLQCDDAAVTERFAEDVARMRAMYGEEDDAVQ